MASPGPETAGYGGNTSCVQVENTNGDIVILDAGSGIRRLVTNIPWGKVRIDILLTHLHLDHILGLGFFAPLHNPDAEVHIWGPASQTLRLQKRLMRYLSPPYFPLHFYELPCQLILHEIFNENDLTIGGFSVTSQLIMHPGPTLGFRIQDNHGRIMAYMPDHEPAIGVRDFPLSPDWTSGYDIAAGADLLIHDAQYFTHEYDDRTGWGHSTIEHAFKFGELAEVKNFCTFHYDPSHTDEAIDDLVAGGVEAIKPSFDVTPGKEGMTFDLD
jgi:ribonuclease BN (tRNA processing enzyme)